MSHEIRHPMNAILGMSPSLPWETCLDRSGSTMSSQDQRSAQHLLGIINDILGFSKIGAGKLDPERIEFNLDHVMENLAAWARKAEAKGVAVSRSITQLDALLYGDPFASADLINFQQTRSKFTEQGRFLVKVNCLEKQPRRCCCTARYRTPGSA